MFEKDLHLPWLDSDGWDEVEELLRVSDVFHFHMTADEHTELGPFRPVDYLRGKMVVHHHHGHPDFRSNPEKYRQKYRERKRRNLLVSTPDLLKLLPEARWQPNLVPIYDPLYMPMENKAEAPIIICHSPTRKDLKNTNEFLYAMEEVRRETALSVETRLIENTPHNDCLRLKRESHVLFDHLQGYFGMSSLEALSQGLCVIAGLDEWNIRHIAEFAGTSELPWVCMTVDKLSHQLKALLSDRIIMKPYAGFSRRFMETCWNDARVAHRLTSTYN